MSIKSVLKGISLFPGQILLFFGARSLFLLVILSFASSSAAQPSNYKFYPRDYAKTPLENEQEEELAKPGQAKKTPVKGRPGPRGTAATSAIQATQNEPTGKKIESLSLIASGLNQEELTKQYQVMLDIFNQKAVQPSTIFLIGSSFDPFTPNLKLFTQRLAMLGVATKVAKEPPNNFKIAKVPAWILTLTEGDIVLEGVDSPNRFINSKGEFIEPEDWEK